jgi:hypothetical protein
MISIEAIKKLASDIEAINVKGMSLKEYIEDIVYLNLKACDTNEAERNMFLNTGLYAYNTLWLRDARTTSDLLDILKPNFYNKCSYDYRLKKAGLKKNKVKV